MFVDRIGRRVCGALVLLLAGAAAPLAAQATRPLYGTVRGAADSAPVADVVVAAIDRPGARSTSGPSGRFVLRAPDGEFRLVVSGIGFRPETLSVASGRGEVDVYLERGAVVLDPVSVAADPVYTTASSRVVRALDVALRPRESSQELLRLAPGLVITQHAGGGKAEQIYLRGFDADHGTDVAVSVDGTPVNLVSHAHGQGYADLHYLIPEVVDVVEVRKGPYDAQDGDLATAGAVAFRTRDRADRAALETRAGSFGTVHGLALVPFGGDVAHAGGYLAAAGHRTDGPFAADQAYRRLNLFGKWTAPVARDVVLVATASAFDARWMASGQIPERAVAAGRIGRFGAIDSTEGGSTSRVELSAGLRGRDGGSTAWEVRGYAVKYRLQLFSNFTFFLVDSLNGDGIEQMDDRYLAGLQAGIARNGFQAGIGARADFADVELHRQRERQRLGSTVLAGISQQHLFGWARREVCLAPRVRARLGLRGDLFRFGVTDRLALSGTPAERLRWHGIVSPKANLAVDLARATTLFASLGAGFHSNDAREVVVGARGDGALPRAWGAELGTRHSWSGGSVAASLWSLDLASELVYVGDEGVTEPSGRTRRIGVDVEGRFRLVEWLWLDADLNLSRGRFRDERAGADRIPLAPTVTSAGGLTVRDLGPFEGGLRYRYIGARAADETNTVRAKGATMAELFGSLCIANVRLLAALDNLFDAEWNEAQFATTSRLRDESAAVTELHFTPGARRSVQVGVEYAW